MAWRIAATCSEVMSSTRATTRSFQPEIRPRSAEAEAIANHARSYEREDFVFDPLHYLALLEHKVGALDQAAPLVGWGSARGIRHAASPDRGPHG